MEQVAKKPSLLPILLGGLLMVGILEVIPMGGGGVLLPLIFWTSIVQGALALVAITEITGAGWIRPLKGDFLALSPLLLFFSILSLLLSLHLSDLYPWMGRSELWFNPIFFMGRTSFLIFCTYLLAQKLGQGEKTYAVLYILSFVTSQSLMAFDWVMSLEYPWFSTLFGAYFFVEAIYSALAFSGILYFLLRHKIRDGETHKIYMKSKKDMATLLFGFGVFWIYLFFSQFLVIWYGNLPEEIGYVAKRIYTAPYCYFSILVFLLCFFIPFVTLMTQKVKGNASLVVVVATGILTGLFIEKLILLLPSHPFNLLLIGGEFLCIGVVFGMVVYKRVLAE